MDIEVPYNALILSAFTNIMKYEKKKSLKVSNINNYIKEILIIVANIYQTEKVVEKINSSSNDWHGDLNFVIDHDYMPKFINKYGQYFVLENDTLTIKEGISYDKTWQLMEQEIKENKINNRFFLPLEDIPVLKTLDIKKIPNILKQCLAMEKTIQQAYLTNVYDEATMAGYALKRIIFLNNLSQLSEEEIKSYFNILIQMAEEQEMFFPINFIEFKNSPYYIPYNPNVDDERMDKMCNYFNKAIFNCENLSEEKLLMMLEDVLSYKWCHFIQNSLDEEDLEEFEETMADEDVIDEAQALFDTDELKFCFTYLDKIQNIIDTYGEDASLIETYRRLLYMIDDPSMELLDRENFLASKEEVEEMPLDNREVLQDFANETYFLCEDIFTKEYSTEILKKILFISSYYEITQDKKIVKILSKYQNHPQYDYYREFILGSEQDKTLKLEP